MKKRDNKGKFIKEIKKVERNCKFCKKIFLSYPKSPQKFCSKKCGNKNQYGFKSPFWKGGKAYRQKNGYVRVYVSQGKYMQEHRAVMEKHLGRKLLRTEGIHHKNGVKNDNRIKNLEVVTRPHHYGKIVCPHCQKDFLIR